MSSLLAPELPKGSYAVPLITVLAHFLWNYGLAVDQSVVFGLFVALTYVYAAAVFVLFPFYVIALRRKLWYLPTAAIAGFIVGVAPFVLIFTLSEFLELAVAPVHHWYKFEREIQWSIQFGLWGSIGAVAFWCLDRAQQRPSPKATDA